MNTRSVTAVALLVCTLAHAESLQGIAPLDTFGDIKKKYPNATFTRVRAAWVTEGEAFFSLTGVGFPGVLYMDFDDSRAADKRFAAKAEAEGAAVAASSASAAEAQSNIAAFFNHQAAQSDDDALTISWVRWVPEAVIPMSRYKARYGEPSKCDYASSDMRPFCRWDERLLQVNLSDDQTKVLSVEAQFTRLEQKAAWDKRFGYHPPSLDDPKTSASASPSAKPLGKAAPKPGRSASATKL